jgi:hypothetical protein
MQLGAAVILALTPVTWAPVDATGQPLQDVSVIFTPAADAETGGVFVSAEPVTVRPGLNGAFAVSLVAGVYAVVITVGQQETRCAVTVPASLTAVDLGTLLPVPLP